VLMERIKVIIDDHFVYEGELTMQTKVIEDLGADSFDIPVLMNVIEDNFHISIQSEEVMGIKTVGDLLNIIQRKISQEETHAG